MEAAAESAPIAPPNVSVFPSNVVHELENRAKFYNQLFLLEVFNLKLDMPQKPACKEDKKSDIKSICTQVSEFRLT